MVLAILDHNRHQNPKTLNIPVKEWEQRASGHPHIIDDQHHVLLSFLPAGQRQLSPQGISLFALHYYSSWIGRLVPNEIGSVSSKCDTIPAI